MGVAYFGGVPCFGTAVSVVHLPERVVEQRTAVAGSSYVAALFGGGRGRRFEISGVLVGDSPQGVMESEALLLALADGIGRDLVDTQGRSWPNVLFEGVYRPDPAGPKETDWGWCLPYRCELQGLQ